MFPFFRLFKDMIAGRRMPKFEHMTDTHVSHHRCMPWDLDLFMELNNGRALTLFDLGRMVLAQRSGLVDILMANNWSMTMAGSSVRYRQRIRWMEKFEVRSRMVCWDDKFIYIEQSMWKQNGTCANHVLYRAAVTDKDGLVRPPRLAEAMNVPNISPEMPTWIAAWCQAEAQRPWPPMQDDTPMLQVAA